MRHHIVVIGDSPLSLQLCRELLSKLGSHAHIDITLIARETTLVLLNQQDSIAGKITTFDLTESLSGVEIIKSSVKQINLHDRRVITSKGTVDYDYLISDQTPIYSVSEIKKIQPQLQRLIHEIQSIVKNGKHIKARVTFAAESVEAWQLALLFAQDISKMSTSVRRSVAIESRIPDWPWLKQFMESNGVTGRKSVGLTPGLTIGSPASPFQNRIARGALLDHLDNFILENTLNPESFPEVTVIANSPMYKCNIAKVNAHLASQIVRNVQRFLEGKAQLPVNRPKNSGLLTSENDSLVWLNNSPQPKWYAKLTLNSENKLIKKLSAS